MCQVKVQQFILFNYSYLQQQNTLFSVVLIREDPVIYYSVGNIVKFQLYKQSENSMGQININLCISYH